MTLIKWDILHSYGMAIMAIGFLFFPSLYLFIFFAFVSFSFLWVIKWKDIRRFSPPGGYPNYITLFRFAGMITLLFAAGKLSDLMLASSFTLLVILDGTDGFLARRLKQKSKFGAVFDMETDAFFVCVVSCLLLKRSMIAGWILIPAFIKYFYTVVMHITGLCRYPEKKTRFGTSIAVVMFLSLSAAFILPEKLRIIILLIASALICLSFIISFIRQLNLRKLY